MLKKRTLFSLILISVIAGSAFAQTAVQASNAVSTQVYVANLQAGMMLYAGGKWEEAIAELQAVKTSPNKTIAGEALFWIALSELSAGNYQKTIDDISALEILDPDSMRLNELSYQKGRAYYYLGSYNEAIVSLTAYTDSFDPDPLLSSNDRSKKAAAWYWIGESLFSMGQFEKAADVFYRIISDYPDSPKYEVSSYRLALINQKKIETELLDLLKYSHEESLRIMEEYQRRERAYDQAILSYQRRINEMLKDSRLADLETANTQYQQQLAIAEERIKSLELKLSEAAGSAPAPQKAENSADRLQALRSSAVEIRHEIEKNLGAEPAAGVSK